MVGSQGLKVTFDSDAEAAKRLEMLKNARKKFQTAQPAKSVNTANSTVPVLVYCDQNTSSSTTQKPATSLLNSSNLSKVHAQVVIGGQTEDAPPSKVILSDGTVLVPVPPKQLTPGNIPQSTSATRSVDTYTKVSSSSESPQVFPGLSHKLKPPELMTSKPDRPVPVKLLKSILTIKDKKELAEVDQTRKHILFTRPVSKDNEEEEDTKQFSESLFPELELPLKIKEEPVDYTSDGPENDEHNSGLHSVSRLSHHGDDTNTTSIEEELGFVIKTEAPDEYLDSAIQTEVVKQTGRKRSRKKKSFNYML